MQVSTVNDSLVISQGVEKVTTYSLQEEARLMAAMEAADKEKEASKVRDCCLLLELAYQPVFPLCVVVCSADDDARDCEGSPPRPAEAQHRAARPHILRPPSHRISGAVLCSLTLVLLSCARIVVCLSRRLRIVPASDSALVYV